MLLKKCHLGIALRGDLGLGRGWICLVGMLRLLGRQMTTRDTANLWFRPPTSYGVLSDDAGAFGVVCESIGAPRTSSNPTEEFYFFL